MIYNSGGDIGYSPTIIITNVECDECDGIGMINGRTEEDCELIDCEKCNGSGKIEIEEYY